MDDTIISESNLGQRLDKLRKSEIMCLYHGSRRVPVLDIISIGRSAENAIVVEDGLVSRRHAIVQKIKADYFVKDLNSTNGVFVNGEQIPEDKYRKLESGDVVRVGRTEMTFETR